MRSIRLLLGQVSTVSGYCQSTSLEFVIVVTQTPQPQTPDTQAIGERPLRADAERNRERILDAAKELFAERGLGVTLNDIAHHAGVGVGTVYRRFPDKMQLIDALFEQRIDTLVGLAEEAVSDPDPWHGITSFLEGSLQLQASDRGLKELVTGMPDGLDRVCRIRDRMLPLGIQLVRRAHESGQLREDIAPTDLAIVQILINAVIDAAREVEPDLWRRYLGVLLRGMSARPDEQPPLPTGPLSPDQIDPVMSAQPARRR
jgi:AcrR family transcriptional regulator